MYVFIPSFPTKGHPVNAKNMFLPSKSHLFLLSNLPLVLALEFMANFSGKSIDFLGIGLAFKKKALPVYPYKLPPPAEV